MTVFGDKVLVGLRWALTYMTDVPMKREFWNTDIAQRKDSVKTQGEDCHLQAKEGDQGHILYSQPSKATNSDDTLVSDFWTSEQ